MNHNDRIQFLARFAYLGHRFYGVQEQPNVPTVLGALRKRIEEIVQKKVCNLVASARTDRHVHALENYATFYLRGQLNVPEFIKAASMHQNDGLYAVSLSHVSPHVHARGNAQGKTYCYYIIDNAVDCDQSHPFAWRVVPHLDLDAIEKAAEHLLGRQDFSSLRGGGCQAGTTIKEIFKINTSRHKNATIAIEIAGNAFLRKMIRNLVGLLVEIGAGLRPVESVPQILAEKSREAAGIMAPAHGLFLTKVDFTVVLTPQPPK